MGPTNNKKKTLKNIKGLDKAHPYSRKATQMKRAILRTSTVSAKDSLRNEPKKRQVDRLLWFKNCVLEIDTVTIDIMHDIIARYIARNEDEIAALVLSWRSGRPKPSRLDLLENVREKDMDDYKTGFEIPNLIDTKILGFLKSWTGDYNSITLIEIVRIKKL